MSVDDVPVAGVVLRDEDGRYLLVQETRADIYGLWGIPAGKMDEGETLQQTAVREANEEVGYTVELIDEQPLLQANDEKGNQRSLTAFRGRITGGDLKAQAGEILDAKWLTLAQVKKLAKAKQLRAPWVLNSILKDDAAHENPGN